LAEVSVDVIRPIRQDLGRCIQMSRHSHATLMNFTLNNVVGPDGGGVGWGWGRTGGFSCCHRLLSFSRCEVKKQLYVAFCLLVLLN
jgi:hypothetical protein